MAIIYEGKAKRLWETANPQVLRMEFKDDATAFNGEKKAVFEDKGRLNNRISQCIFQRLEQMGIATHFIGCIDERNVAVKRVEIVPIEVIVRNRAAGSFVKRTGMAEGQEFHLPVVDFCLKSDELGDPLINEDTIRELGLATSAEVHELRCQALRINDFLKDLFARAGLVLVDFKLEFGRLPEGGGLVLADEISPDGCRLWDRETGEKMDKDRFRRDLGGFIEAYREVLRRLEGTEHELQPQHLAP